MNAIVTARVPAEIKAQVEAKLKRMSATPTELINAAYKYVLENDEIPVASKQDSASKPTKKVLTDEMAEQFNTQWKNRAVLGDPYNGENFKDLLDEARGEYFARFA